MNGNGRYLKEVNECERFQPAYKQVVAGMKLDGELLTLQVTLMELPYDPANYHPVQVEVKGHILGYLRDRAAKRFFHQFRRDQHDGIATCPIRIHIHCPKMGHVRANSRKA